MLRCLVVVFWLSSWPAAFAGRGGTDDFFSLLNALEFDKAKTIAGQEEDPALRFEMLQLANILFYEGQVSKDTFKLSAASPGNDVSVSVISSLNKGYIDLFYNRINGNSYRHFYNAYQLAKNNEDPVLIKACLLALLKYYNSEIGQNTHYHLPYLKQLESLQSSPTDRFWVTIYKMVFFTQSFQQLDDEYFKLTETLDGFEKTLDQSSPLLAYLYYEKALQHDIKRETPEAIAYYNKTIGQAGDYKFLRYFRFNAKLKLMIIEMSQGKFDRARRYLAEAKNEIDEADTLRSNYTLNLHSALVLKAQQRYDSAFNYLWKATREEFQLSFTRNSLEISRLNVELETQEKENANLSLRQNRIWLLSALVIVALLFIASYLAYANQKVKTRIQVQEKEVQTMKMEKLLKDQEIISIDAMLDGQERERKKIADDLHDNLGSLLTTIKFNFQGLLKKKDHVELELLQKTDGLLDEAYQKIRAIAHTGNAGVNAKDGLLPSVRNFISKISAINQLSIEVKENGMDEPLDNTLEIMIFRIIQELVTNAIKHAKASEVIINLTRHDSVINLMVEDNGVGFDKSAIKPEATMGLRSIQKKIENLGGTVTIDSENGTAVIIDIPLL